MKRIIGIILILLIGTLAYAKKGEKYTILALNTPFLNVDGKKFKEGDTFNAKATIYWESDKQAVRVLSSNNLIILLTPKDDKLKDTKKVLKNPSTSECWHSKKFHSLMRDKAKSLAYHSYDINAPRDSTSLFAPTHNIYSEIESLKLGGKIIQNSPEEYFTMSDTLRFDFDFDLKINKKHYIIAEQNIDGYRISKKLPYETYERGEIPIDSVFLDNFIKQSPLMLDIKYVNFARHDTIIIAENLKFILSPENIEEK